MKSIYWVISSNRQINNIRTLNFFVWDQETIDDLIEKDRKDAEKNKGPMLKNAIIRAIPVGKLNKKIVKKIFEDKLVDVCTFSLDDYKSTTQRVVKLLYYDDYLIYANYTNSGGLVARLREYVETNKLNPNSFKVFIIPDRYFDGRTLKKIYESENKDVSQFDPKLRNPIDRAIIRADYNKQCYTSNPSVLLSKKHK